MRVGLLIYGSLDTLSGGYLYDRKLAQYLREQGDTVEVISLPWRSYPRHLGDNFNPELRGRLDRLDVDLLLQDELNHPSLFLANGPLLWKGRFPLLSIVHHLRSNEIHPRPLLPFYRAVERRYLRSVEGFIFNSHTTRAAVEKLIGSASRGVVAYPAGDQFGQLSREEYLAHSQYHQPPLKLLFIGNLIPRKGLHTLLSALRSLPTGSVEVRVVGRADVDPGYFARLRRAAAALGDCVLFLGRLEDDQIRQELRRADLLAVPSTYEGFGIVYLEGMAYGLPSIATTSGAAGEIVQNGLNGWLVPPENPKAIAKVLSSLINDPDQLNKMKRSARERFDQFPTWRETAQSIRQFLLSWI